MRGREVSQIAYDPRSCPYPKARDQVCGTQPPRGPAGTRDLRARVNRGSPKPTTPPPYWAPQKALHGRARPDHRASDLPHT